MMKNLKFVRKMKRKQLVALVQSVLDAAVQSFLYGLPHAMNKEERKKEIGDHRSYSDETRYERGVIRMLFLSLASLAKARGVTVADDEVALYSPTSHALRRMMEMAWSTGIEPEIAKLSEAEDAEREIARLLDTAWPDTKELAKQFVDELKLKPKASYPGTKPRKKPKLVKQS